MRKIVIDLGGSDRGEGVILEGLRATMEARKDFTAVIVGTAAAECSLKTLGFDLSRVEYLPAAEVITNFDSPMSVFRGKPEASLSKAYQYLRENEDAVGLLSAGNTGAVLIGSIFCLGLMEGLKCPALCSVLPCADESRVCLLDCGANMDCTVEDLQRFALMGSAYMKNCLSLEAPKVALLSIGRERGKGNKLIKEAYAAIEALPVNFVGLVEGGDVLTGEVDVVVCDGLAGNLILKNAEAVGLAAKRLALQEAEAAQQTETKEAMQRLAGRLFHFFDFNSQGGGVLLGTKKVVVKAHGAANAATIRSCIEQLCRIVDGGFTASLTQQLKDF